MVRCSRALGDQRDARSRARVRHRLASDDPSLSRVARARASSCSVGARLRLRLRHSRDRRGEARRKPRRRRGRRSARRGRRAANAAANGVAAAFMLPDGLGVDSIRCRRRQHPRESRCACSRLRSLRVFAPAGASCFPACSPTRRRTWPPPMRRGLSSMSGSRARTAGSRWQARESDRHPADPFSAVAVRTPASIGTRDARRKIYPLSRLPHGLSRDAAAARDARGPGALRPLQDGVRRRRAADLARAAGAARRSAMRPTTKRRRDRRR